MRNITAADMASASALRQIASELGKYVCDDNVSKKTCPVEGSEGKENGNCTEPTLLAVAMEHQQNRAEVMYST